MLRVGLTGGIGSGKTTVSEIFHSLDVPVIDTDEIAREIASVDGPAYSSIVNSFGSSILNQDGSINRRKLAEIVFNSHQDKHKLEQILHPLIWLLTEQKIQQLESAYCIIVVPLLFEGQHQQRFNAIIVVDADEQQQLSRVESRDRRSRNDILDIMSHQLSREQRLLKADYIINNTGDIRDLRQQVEALHATFQSLSTSA